MRIIVTGDRNWYDVELAESILARLISRYGPSLTIVHGGATGIDRSFAEACGEVGIDQEVYPARWNELDHPEAVIREAVIRHDKNGRPYNAAAGLIRNAEMVSAGADMVIALHRAIGTSKGTRDCIRQALAAGIAVYLIDSDAAVSRRVLPGDPRVG